MVASTSAIADPVNGTFARRSGVVNLEPASRQEEQQEYKNNNNNNNDKERELFSGHTSSGSGSSSMSSSGSINMKKRISTGGGGPSSMPLAKRKRALRIWLTSSVNILRLIWLFSLYYNERWRFKLALEQCAWQTWEKWPAPSKKAGGSIASPTRISLIGDPQLVDDNTYPGRSRVGMALTRFYADEYMRRNWNYLYSVLDPNLSIFLGDLFDGGREWDDGEWLKEYFRFWGVFDTDHGDREIIDTLPGNHDIGFSDSINQHALHRFRAHFGDTSSIHQVANHSIILLDSISLTNKQDPSVYEPQREFLNQLKENYTTDSLPRILITHVPLFRDSSVSCGPDREHKGQIPYNAGYQYQNLIDPQLSQEILECVNPIMIFSGDDHDACDVVHKFNVHGSARRVQEHNVKSFSMAMGINYPGIQFLSLNNPTGASQEFLLATNDPITMNGFPTIQTIRCGLPSQYDVFISYGILGLLTIGILVGEVLYYRPPRQRSSSVNNGGQRSRNLISKFLASQHVVVNNNNNNNSTTTTTTNSSSTTIPDLEASIESDNKKRDVELTDTNTISSGGAAVGRFLAHRASERRQRYKHHQLQLWSRIGSVAWVVLVGYLFLLWTV